MEWIYLGCFVILISGMLARYFNSRYTCPNCNRPSKIIQREELFYSKFKYARENGMRDKRFNDNYLINKYKIRLKCTDPICSKEFTEVITKNKITENDYNDLHHHNQENLWGNL